MNRFLVILILIVQFGLSKSIQKKVDKQITATFNVQKYTLTEVIIDSEIIKILPSAFGKDNLFKIDANNSILGYAYISKAFGKVDYFDYLVLLDKDLGVLKTKILVYREDYGGEIGSKRWLKQFIGKTKNDELIYGDNIAAISGATISANALVDDLNSFDGFIDMIKMICD